MGTKSCLRLLLALWVVALLPRPAHAQYRNKAFGFDLSYELISRPKITDSDGFVLPTGSRGNRLGYGIRLGGEGSFKLHHDHWWFSARPGLTIYRFNGSGGASLEAQADQLGGANVGTPLGLGAQAGVRYYFLTDHFRPYLQVSASYEHIFTFGDSATATCSDPTFCGGNRTYGDEFLPHTNLLAVHVAPSFEIIVSRDISLHLLLDYRRWVVFSGSGNNVFTFGLGVLFYG